MDQDLHLKVKGTLNNMPLCLFAKKYNVGTKGKFRNKIVKRDFDKTVVIFYPHVKSGLKASSYPRYCKLALLKFKPWANASGQEPFEGNIDPTEDEYISEWEKYLKDCHDNGWWVPDVLQREIDNYILHRNDMTSENATSMMAADDTDLEETIVHEDVEDANFLEINNFLPMYREMTIKMILMK